MNKPKHRIQSDSCNVRAASVEGFDYALEEAKTF